MREVSEIKTKLNDRSASADPPRFRPRLLPLLMAVAASGGAGVLAVNVPQAAARPLAHAARTINLSESGYLRYTSHNGFTLNEAGSSYGTIRGSIYIHLNIVSTNRVTAEVNIYPHGGSITGYAKANYRVSGGTANFSGSMTVARGTGRYNHAHGSGLAFYGNIRRSDDAVTVYLTGRMYD